MNKLPPGVRPDSKHWGYLGKDAKPFTRVWIERTYNDADGHCFEVNNERHQCVACFCRRRDAEAFCRLNKLEAS